MSSELRGLAGKRVLITGGGKGQGANHARAFAAAGCDVAVLDIDHDINNIYPLSTAAMIAETIKEIESCGRQAVGVVADLRDELAVKKAIDEVIGRLGQIDIVVNNAGVAALDTIHDMRSDVMNAVIDTNLKGAMHVAKYTVGPMIGRYLNGEESGKIINIASAVVGSGHAMLSHYVAAKHGVVGLTSAWAMELSEFNINVNAVCPGTIEPGAGRGSGMVQGLSGAMDMPPMEAFETFSAQGNMPGSKWRCTSQDITDMVLFLASDNARVITGAIIPVDGGQMAK
jgi:NAD(P)-dependent dehydrogenase (short-subunit alcohol dehydrogenase family)